MKNKSELIRLFLKIIDPRLKLYPKFLEPYSVTRVLRNDRYAVQKSEHEGLQTTSTAVDYLKPWINDGHGSLFEDSDSDWEIIGDQMLNQDDRV